MTQFDKALEKFNRKPIPNDITYSELFYIVKKYGFEVDVGKGKRTCKVQYKKLGIKIPIPIHGNVVKEAYIEQVKRAIERVLENDEL